MTVKKFNYDSKTYKLNNRNKGLVHITIPVHIPTVSLTNKNVSI